MRPKYIYACVTLARYIYLDTYCDHLCPEGVIYFTIDPDQVIKKFKELNKQELACKNNELCNRRNCAHQPLIMIFQWYPYYKNYLPSNEYYFEKDLGLKIPSQQILNIDMKNMGICPMKFNNIYFHYVYGLKRKVECDEYFLSEKRETRIKFGERMLTSSFKVVFDLDQPLLVRNSNQ